MVIDSQPTPEWLCIVHRFTPIARVHVPRGITVPRAAPWPTTQCVATPLDIAQRGVLGLYLFLRDTIP